MTNNLWWKKAIIYEVYVDKFAKNFRGMTEKLPYLKNLGINCIWILPHYPSPMIDDGYDVSDYCNARSELGTLDDFKNFTQKAHQSGIRIIIDFVLNHVSTEHPWFRERKDFFLRSKTGKEFPKAVNPFSHMKPSNWILDPTAGDYYFATFYPQQADLNWDNSEVFDEMMRVVDFWINNGVDGFRLDAAPFLIKREGTACVNLPETHKILKKIRAYVENENPNVILLAEANGPLERVMEYFGGLTGSPQAQGDECHMAFNFHLMTALFLALKRGDGSVIEKIIRESFDIPDNCQWATFLRNHDDLTLSHVSQDEKKELFAWLAGEGTEYNFEGTHGVSIRLANIFGGDKNKILNAFKTFFEAPGSPVIYYGDEIGMKNIKLPEKPADTRKYIRGEFDWGEAERQIKDKNSLFSQVSKIIKNRD